MNRYPRTLASLAALVVLVALASAVPVTAPWCLAVTLVGAAFAMRQERVHAHG